MYIPENYKNENAEEIRNFIKSNAFGILITHHNGKSCATHIPLEYLKKDDGTEVLHGHISKANEQTSHFTQNCEALCIFNGPHAYISNSWYDFEEVPTWNYIAAQVRGTLKTLNTEALKTSLSTLVDKYEAAQKKPIALADLSDRTMRQIHGIIGFEIEIKSIEAAYKLSQNRDQKNHDSIVSHLCQSSAVNDQNLGIAMQKERSKKTNS